MIEELNSDIIHHLFRNIISTIDDISHKDIAPHVLLES